MHALACLVLDFTLFTFYPTFNVLSKRQSRNLSANTAINVFQSTPDHSLRTVLSLSLIAIY